MIPCYITVFELHTWPAALAEECVRLGLRPIFLNNGSTYGPCIDWLYATPHPVHHVGYNAGCHAFWSLGLHKKQDGPYVVCDSDLCLAKVPDDAMAKLQAVLALHPKYSHAGLSLEIDDLPPHYELCEEVRIRERGYWARPLEGGCYDAQIDTTFALYLPEREAIRAKNGYIALRLDRPYTAHHLPWYLDYRAGVSPELDFYIQRAESYAMWSKRHRTLLEGSS